MIITKQKDISVQIDPISFIAGIKILSGNSAQTYNQDSKEYEPDRKIVPCIIMPYVSVSDPEDMMNGLQDITGVEWYEGAPKQDNSNRITTNADYVISDEGTPKFSLKVKKNIEPNKPIEVFGIFTITDKRRNTEVKFTRSIPFYTAYYDIRNYSVRIDQPESLMIDPLKEKADSQGRWMHSITAQLYSGATAAADDNAAYWWDVNDGSGWRDVTEKELAIFISGKNSDGTWNKTITYDARFIRNLSFRCHAKYYEGSQKPSDSESSSVAVCVVNVQISQTLDVQIKQTAGAKVNAKMTTPVSFEVVIMNKDSIIGDDKMDLFSVRWKLRTSKVGVADKVIGSGKTVSFIPASLGVSPSEVISVYAEVDIYSVTTIVEEQGKLVTEGGKGLTAKLYN